jgi:flagellar biosynthesis protein FlhG
MMRGVTMEILLPKPQARAAPHKGAGGPTVISVLSGKGGVGKTILSANLAVAIASESRRVLLVDCDLSAGQSHMVLGISPVSGLAQVLRGEKGLSQILVKSHKNLYLVPGGPSGGSAVELQGAEVRRLAVEARQVVPSLTAVLMDVGSGRPAAASDFAGVAEIPLVVTTPEPTAVRATLALLEAILSERPDAKLYLLVNMAADEAEARETFDKMSSALLPVFSGDLSYLGWIPFDLEVTRSLCRYRPVVTSAPRGRAARGLLALREALAPLLDGRSGLLTDTQEPDDCGAQPLPPDGIQPDSADGPEGPGGAGRAPDEGAGDGDAGDEDTRAA